MSGNDLGGKVFDILVRYPVSFLTGKDPEEVQLEDALPVYAGAALWPLAILGISGCDAQGEDEYVWDEIDLNGQTLEIYDCSLQPEFIRLHNRAKILFYCEDVEIDTERIEIDATSSIELVPHSCSKGDGSAGGGSYDGGGGGGGSHIGVGGIGGDGSWDGVGGSTSEIYGSAGDFIAEPGSCGGGGGGPYGAEGGFGGGSLIIIADEAIIRGAINARGGSGEDALYDDGGGGGGSGGAILISTRLLFVDPSTTEFSVRGGDGGLGGYWYPGRGGGGGGGSGGSIELEYYEARVQDGLIYYGGGFEEFISTMDGSGCLDVSGGVGGPGSGQPGLPGEPGAVNAVMP